MRTIFDKYVNGVLIFVPDIFEDHRGKFVETYNKNIYSGEIRRCILEEVEFVQDDISISHRNVLRGFHGDRKTYKLVSCSYGRIFVVIASYQQVKDSLKYELKQYTTHIITGENHKQILVPPGCGLATLCLSDMCVFQYKQSTYYDRDSQFTVKWNEFDQIVWPINNPILSERDK